MGWEWVTENVRPSLIWQDSVCNGYSTTQGQVSGLQSGSANLHLRDYSLPLLAPLRIFVHQFAFICQQLLQHPAAQSMSAGNRQPLAQHTVTCISRKLVCSSFAFICAYLRASGSFFLLCLSSSFAAAALFTALEAAAASANFLSFSCCWALLTSVTHLAEYGPCY